MVVSFLIVILLFSTGARQVFDRWMEWEPDEQAWLTYIKFEMRYKEIDRARKIYERFVYVHPEVKNWIKFAKYVFTLYSFVEYIFSCTPCNESLSFIQGLRKTMVL